jgi:chemotaxis protein MotB
MEKDKGHGNKKQPVIIVKKVKAKGHGGHHGGAWKVAYADFVTAMMALFLVLWLVSTADSSLKQGIADYFRQPPGVFDTLTPAGPLTFERKDSFLEPLQELQERLSEELEAIEEAGDLQKQIRISITPEGLLIDVLDSDKRSFFESGSADITPILAEVLERMVPHIAKLPTKIMISGHTDAHPYRERGAFYSNWELSVARALNTRRTMEKLGLPSKMLDRIIGYADSAPLLPNDPFNPANRRISILVEDASNLPALAQLTANSADAAPDSRHR